MPVFKLSRSESRFSYLKGLRTSMHNLRKPYALLIAFALAFASCSPEKGADAPTPKSTRQEATATRTSTPTLESTRQSVTPTYTGTASAEAPEPICFSPYELLPFTFFPDSSQLLVRSSGGIQFIDLDTGKEVAFVPAHEPILTAALSPDGETLAWALADTTIQLVQVADGTVQHTLIAHPDPVFHLRFSPTGTELISASHDRLVRMWDTQTGKPLPPIDMGVEVVGIGVSPDGATLATIPAYGPIQLWDIASGRQTATLGGTGGYDTSDAVFSPDGKYLASDLATGLFLWSLPDGQLIWNDVNNSMAVTYSPEGRFLTYSEVGEDNEVILTAPDAQGNSLVIDHMQGSVWELFFSPDGSLLAATDGIEIRVWHVPDGNLLLIGKSACSEGPSSTLPSSPALRQFDPTAQYVAGVTYPQELLSLADTDLTPLACTPEYFSWSGISHEYFDPSTQEQHALDDPSINSYLQAAQKLNPGKNITSISLCESDGNAPLVFFRVGPCGGGCAGIPNIAQGHEDGTLDLLAIIQPVGDGAYYGCFPLQLSKSGELYLSCTGEGTAIIRRVSLPTREISVIQRCKLQTTSASCITE
jgi:hypothetical protein